MLRTGTNNNGAEIHPIIDNSPPEISEELEGVFSVPLSAAKLDVSFDQLESAAIPEELALSSTAIPKSFRSNTAGKAGRASKTGRIESTDQVTARLTLPLRTKLLLVFGGFAVLFLVSFGLAGWLFFGLTAQNETAVNQHLRLDRVHQLQLAFGNEQAAITRLILNAENAQATSKAVNDFEFTYYHITFENNLYLLRHEPDNQALLATLREVERRYDNVTTIYSSIIEDLKGGTTGQAHQRWQEAAQYNEDLTARLQDFAHQQGQLAETSKALMEQKQGDSLLGLGLIGVCGAILLLLLIWLANRFVIGPMGKLNVKLGQLLYGQTTRITDHLNVLEHELNSQSEKVAAARHDLKIPLSNIRNIAEVSLLCHADLASEVKENFDEIIETTISSSGLINCLLARPDNRLEVEVVDLSALVERVAALVDLRDFKLHVQVELAEAVMDAQLIEHVLLNLLSNARKFSTGGIGIGTRWVPLQWGSTPLKKESDGEVELWVWNDGPVISANEREIIFRPGGQTAIGREVGGQGLGLSIVKSIVERHGGRVLVESHEKVGTTFRVFLPYSVIYSGWEDRDATQELSTSE